MIEEIIMIGVWGNLIIQFYDIVICRLRNCGNKNSKEK